MISSVIFLTYSVFLPVKTIVFIWFFFANSRALITFLLLPDVEIPITTSSFWPSASSCLENKNSNPKSFPIAVRVDVSVERDKAAIAFLFLLNLTVNSVERCCASEALPPLPKNIIFFFFL